LTDDARDLVADLGWDAQYGARPLKRAIQRHIVDPLAMDVLQGRFREGDTVEVDRAGDALKFRKAESSVEAACAAP
jgi:ATP-dependent Clp protease ATP-binding subunit ClpB